MGRVGEDKDIAFVVSTGDNFYESGLKNGSDPQFEQSFTNVYTAPSLQRQWYAGEESRSSPPLRGQFRCSRGSLLTLASDY
jgi:hypothetical protein